jgi:hypothetical protein
MTYEVKRYHTDGTLYVTESGWGPYPSGHAVVLASDYDALKAEYESTIAFLRLQVEGMRERILGEYDLVSTESVLTAQGTNGAQIVNGHWYVPRWGCDQLDHVLDSALSSLPASDLRENLDSVLEDITNAYELGTHAQRVAWVDRIIQAAGGTT